MKLRQVIFNLFLAVIFLVAPFQTEAETVSITQDDWSGGDSQVIWSDETKFNQEEGEGLYLNDGLKMKINADVVVGQDNFDNNFPYSADPSNNNLAYPRGMFYDGNKFFVVDQYNNRVLIYNSIPTTNGAAADVVIGQTDFTTNVKGTSNSKLSSPRGIYSDGNRLVIADALNNRVLIYNSIPTTNGAVADVVIGQTDFNTATSGTSNTKLDCPVGVVLDGAKLFITDEYNHRVLIYNSIPTTNGAVADVVIGQTDFDTDTSGTSSTKLSYPLGIQLSGAKFLINDYYNNRVLIYNSIPTTNGAAADVVIGQTDFNTATSGTSNTKLSYLSDVFFYGTKLFVSDTYNSRVLIYNSIPTTNGAVADVVIGQTDFNSGNVNRYQISNEGNGGVTHVALANNKLIVSDTYSNRVLIYNSIPTTNGVAADVVIGQPDFNTITPGVSSSKMNYPRQVYSDGTKLFVVEDHNHRVLIYNTIPTTNGAAADVVIGQTDFDTATNGTSSTKLTNPDTISSDGTKLFVGDKGNNRVLIYNTIPTTNGAAADVIVGQSDFNTRTNGTSSTKMRSPFVFSDGNKLLVADSGNHRVLIYNTIPTTNGAAADVVIGQTDFDTRTSGTSSTKLNTPYGVYFYRGKLFIADTYNDRVLIYDEIPTENGIEADNVIGGNGSFSSDIWGLGREKLNGPYDIYSTDSKLVVADNWNYRVLIFNYSEVSSTLTSSTFTSDIDQDWGPISWEADTPDNTEINVEISTDEGNIWNEVKNGDDYIGRGKTMTYRVTLISKDGLTSPIFHSISFGQDAKDNTGIFSFLKKLFGSTNLKIKNNQIVKTQNNNPTLQGEEAKLKNGKIKVYADDKIKEEITIDENGAWSEKLKFKNNKTYNLAIKYFDQYNSLLKTEKLKLKIDSTKPTFKEKIVKLQTITRATKIYFTATDSYTSISYYRVKLLDSKGHTLKSWRNQKADYYLVPKDISNGNYTLFIKAYDGAKNHADKLIDISLVDRAGR